MAWTKVDEMLIERYIKLVVGGTTTIDKVPLKYQEEIKTRVANWFTAEALAK